MKIIPVLILSVLALTACGSSGGTSTPPAPPGPVAPPPPPPEPTFEERLSNLAEFDPNPCRARTPGFEALGGWLKNDGRELGGSRVWMDDVGELSDPASHGARVWATLGCLRSALCRRALQQQRSRSLGVHPCRWAGEMGSRQCQALLFGKTFHCRNLGYGPNIRMCAPAFWLGRTTATIRRSAIAAKGRRSWKRWRQTHVLAAGCFGFQLALQESTYSTTGSWSAAISAKAMNASLRTAGCVAAVRSAVPLIPYAYLGHGLARTTRLAPRRPPPRSPRP